MEKWVLAWRRHMCQVSVCDGWKQRSLVGRWSGGRRLQVFFRFHKLNYCSCSLSMWLNPDLLVRWHVHMCVNTLSFVARDKFLRCLFYQPAVWICLAPVALVLVPGMNDVCGWWLHSDPACTAIGKKKVQNCQAQRCQRQPQSELTFLKQYGYNTTAVTLACSCSMTSRMCSYGIINSRVFCRPTMMRWPFGWPWRDGMMIRVEPGVL